MKETTAAATTTTDYPSSSNMLLSPELVEIAEFLVGLSDRIEGRPREPAWNAVNPFGLPTTWSVKKKRSVPSDSPPPKTTLPPPKTMMVSKSSLTGEVNGSPATPLGFSFSGGEVSDCKQESNPARAKTNNELQRINLNVPQQNDSLRMENLDKKEKTPSSSEANLNLAAPSALQQLTKYSTIPKSQASTWYIYQRALIFSATAQFCRFPLAPRPPGIPDLNLSIADESCERIIMEDRSRPLHRVQNALHGKMMNLAMAAQARKNRIQIIKLKSFKKLPRVRHTS
ncbi:hypothetical protein Droror1_Dr00010257 [Drosera rotundifolia]